VAALLKAEGLQRYYELAGGPLPPASSEETPVDDRWLEPLVTAAELGGGTCALDLSVQGVHCAACVWLIEQLCRKDGGLACRVNPALGTAALAWRPGAFSPSDFALRLRRFGYRLGPAQQQPESASTLSEGHSGTLAVRIGITAALTMNTMLLSASFYAGLGPQDGALFLAFRGVSLALATAAVAVGAWPFLTSAWEALRRRVLHLDLPIAVGLVLVYATSVVQLWRHPEATGYLDTLCTFITLMLVGRWLQERWLARNRRQLLGEADFERLLALREESGRLVERPVGSLRAGDRLHVGPGAMVSCPSLLDAPQATLSMAWIDGESQPRTLSRGDAVAAGAFNTGRSSIAVVVTAPFAASPLPRLLQAAAPGADRPTRLFSLVSRWYVPAVLLIAIAGAVLWWRLDPSRVLDVTVAVLVVTCPCAVGIALPLAHELVLSALRRRGVYVRSGDLLSRMTRVRRLLLDKTGTVTLSRLELESPEVLDRLTGRERDIAYTIASGSQHPVSRAVARVLSARRARLLPQLEVIDHPGRGLSTTTTEGEWRLGSATFCGVVDDGATHLTRDGQPILNMRLREELRPGTAGELSALGRRGVESWLVSGDSAGRVGDVAARLGLERHRVLAAQSPDDKAALVRRLDAQDTLFVGDGVNDALAFEAAFCAGAASADRPVMPGRADFFLVGDSLHGIGALVRWSRRLQATTRQVLWLALIYNVLAVAASLAGWMSPLRAAVAMPASSLSLLLLTWWRLRSDATAHAPSIKAIDHDGSPDAVAQPILSAQREA